jgi:C4-dicarboxylate-specific signal transduction histidine kinase
MRRHDGIYRWLVDRGVPRYSSDGAFLGYIGSCNDITDRKEADAEVHWLGVELAHASRVSTMGQLAAALAHELSQPLEAILSNVGAGELILRKANPDYGEIRAIFADVRDDNMRAAAVIGRMRSLLQRHELEFEAIDLEQLVDQVKVLVHTQMMSRRVSLEVALPADLPLVRGDRVHLQQVLLNILINGADAINGCEDQPRRIEVSARRGDEGMVEVAVSDTGHGVPKEKLDQLFETFFTTKADGMGMGLAISRTIVSAHGGRIWAENNADRGATFRFTLKILVRHE